MAERDSLVGRRRLEFLRGSFANEPIHKFLCLGMKNAIRSEHKGNDACSGNSGVGVLICSDLIIVGFVQVSEKGGSVAIVGLNLDKVDSPWLHRFVE